MPAVFQVLADRSGSRQYVYIDVLLLFQPLLTILLIDACQAAVSSPIVWVTFASSVVTDIYLIMIPLPSMPIPSIFLRYSRKSRSLGGASGDYKYSGAYLMLPNLQNIDQLGNADLAILQCFGERALN